MRFLEVGCVCAGGSDSSTSGFLGLNKNFSLLLFIYGFVLCVCVDLNSCSSPDRSIRQQKGASDEYLCGEDRLPEGRF